MKSIVTVFILIMIVVVIDGCKPKNPNTKTDKVKNTESSREEVVSKVKADLQIAYKNEKTQSIKDYEYSKVAKSEGYTHLSFLFTVISETENIQATNLGKALDALGEIVPDIKPNIKTGNSIQNLNEVMNSELDKVVLQYSDFKKLASDGNITEAFLPLNFAIQTDKVYKNYFKEALKEIKDTKDESIPDTYWICPTCGNIFMNSSIPEHCQISITPKSQFVQRKMK